MTATIAHNLRDRQQMLDEFPYLKKGGLDWLLFHRNTNGLNKAVVRVGRRLFIDIAKFAEWLEEHREVVSDGQNGK